MKQIEQWVDFDSYDEKGENSIEINLYSVDDILAGDKISVLFDNGLTYRGEVVERKDNNVTIYFY